jgi:hypothetical protein
MAKPFIAARVPQRIEDKLNERVQETKLGKTEIIVNALAVYLGCSIDVPEETHAVDRLVAVEKELSELKNRIAVLEKSSNPAIQKELLLDNNIVNEADKTLKPKKSSKQEIVQNNDNSTDKKAENTNRAGGSSDINSDNKSLTHHEMSGLTGISFETVRGRYKKSTPIEWDGKQYNPIREEKRQKWQTLDNKSD